MTRLRESDCLAEWHAELCAHGRTLPSFDLEARAAFVEASRQLLAAVPDAAQRTAWRIQHALAFGAHLPLTQVVQQLSHYPEARADEA